MSMQNENNRARNKIYYLILILYYRMLAIWKWKIRPHLILVIGSALLLVALFIATIGYLNQHEGLYLGKFLGNFLGDYYANLSAELASIAITVLIINSIYKQQEREKEKSDLIVQMRSPDNAIALEAVRKMIIRGWGMGDDKSLFLAMLIGANLKDVYFIKANLINAFLIEANLENANLLGANLWGAALEKANLINSNLQLANLTKAGLYSANLNGANLEEANLSEATLVEAKFLEANLRKTNLTGTDMRNAILYEKEKGVEDVMDETKFAQLDGAILSGSNLQGAIVTDEQLKQAETLDGATMPDGKLYDGRFDKKVE